MLFASLTRQFGFSSALPRSQSLAWLGIFFILPAAKAIHMLKRYSSRCCQSFFFLLGLSAASLISVFKCFYPCLVPLRFTAD